MKEKFTEGNITNSDIAKSVFEKHWLRSAPANKPSGNTHYKRRLLSSSSGGYGAPAIISIAQYEEQDTH